MKTEIATIREALDDLDAIEADSCCNDFDNAQDALAALKKVEARIAELESTNQFLRSTLYNCAAHAGLPDAATGCRAIIATVKDALSIP